MLSTSLENYEHIFFSCMPEFMGRYVCVEVHLHVCVCMCRGQSDSLSFCSSLDIHKLLTGNSFLLLLLFCFETVFCYVALAALKPTM